MDACLAGVEELQPTQGLNDLLKIQMNTSRQADRQNVNKYA